MAFTKRPIWRVFVPTTCAAKLRSAAVYAPYWLFAVATYAILQRQCHYRNNLALEAPETYDRVDRRAYVALPDGRMALVYPIIDTQMSFTRVVGSFLEALNPLP